MGDRRARTGGLEQVWWDGMGWDGMGLDRWKDGMLCKLGPFGGVGVDIYPGKHVESM